MLLLAPLLLALPRQTKHALAPQKKGANVEVAKNGPALEIFAAGHRDQVGKWIVEPGGLKQGKRSGDPKDGHLSKKKEATGDWCSDEYYSGLNYNGHWLTCPQVKTDGGATDWCKDDSDVGVRCKETCGCSCQDFGPLQVNFGNGPTSTSCETLSPYCGYAWWVNDYCPSACDDCQAGPDPSPSPPMPPHPPPPSHPPATPPEQPGMPQQPGSTTGPNLGPAPEYVADHNSFRDLHENTHQLAYNASLAADAQAYADSCATGHPDANTPAQFQLNGNGENIYWAGTSQGAMGPDVEWEGAISSWYSEIKDYLWPATYGAPRKKGVIGHFTQVVWKATTQVGCGINRNCNNMWSGWYNTVVICRCASPLSTTPAHRVQTEQACCVRARRL